MKLGLITCERCGDDCARTGRRQLYCRACREIVKGEQAYASDVRTGRISKPGVGSGGDQRGERNPAWRGGVASYRAKLKSSCERCGGARFLGVHHRDRDRGNNVDENLETLCRSCHQREHRAADHLNQHVSAARRRALAINMAYQNKTLPRVNGRNASSSKEA